MSRPAERLATYEDLLDLPDHVTGEILHGRLVTQPRPAPKHARSASILGGELVSPFDQGRGGPGGWWILDEPELHLGPHILAPDLAGWRRERMPVFPDTAWFDVAPDWVCEVLSPSTARTDRVIKMPIYAERGVEWLWLVDPDQQTLEVYQRHDDHWLMLYAWQQADEVAAPPFIEHRFALNDLWLPPAPDSP